MGWLWIGSSSKRALRHARAGILAVIFRIELLLDPFLPMWCYFDKPILFFREGRHHPSDLGGNNALMFLALLVLSTTDLWWIRPSFLH